MKIISAKEIDMTLHGRIMAGRVYCIHVKVDDVGSSAKSIIDMISDVSWINKLEPAQQVAFRATSERTVQKLVGDILSKVTDEVTSDFGEYLVSYTAQHVLELHHTHVKVPLAELLKEKVIGNPGFDFHTESDSNHIIFG